MKRKILSFLLALSMILSLLPVQAFAVDTANPFRDVSESDWYYDAVQYTRVNGFFEGTPEATFNPDDTMTRGMFVTVLGRMAGMDTEQYQGISSFSDVPEGAYFAPYVAWASKYGITIGTGDGKFSPDALIDRQQMATFFVRYFDIFGVDYETGANITTTPADIDSTADFARDAVLKLWRQGLLNGDGVSFHPGSNATRAQAATLCCRMDQAVETWYKEPGVPSGRVKIDPATGRPYGEQDDQPAEPTETPPSSGGGSGDPVDPDDPGDSIYPSSCSVSFYDGTRLIDTFIVEEGEPLGAVPSVSKSSKAGAILIGYYTDPDFNTPFYPDNPVTGDMNVYARYEDMDTGELTIDSFARMDEEPSVSFRFKPLDGTSGSAEAAVKLAVKDGSDPVDIAVKRNSDGTYTVYAPKGFNRGCSYELTLAEGWTFLPDGSGAVQNNSIRTAAFSIYMKEVENLQMSGGIKYIQDTDSINYQVDGKTMDVLANNTDLSRGGSFNYDNASGLNPGDILCIYVGKLPGDKDRSATDPAVYVKVDSIDGDTNTVTFKSLDENDQAQLYEVPDNFPIKVDALPTEENGVVDFRLLDTDLYAQMVGQEKGTPENAKAALSVGDFVSLYVDSKNVNEDLVYFGRITGVTGDTVTFKQCTAEDIRASADLYQQVNLSGEDLITDEEKAQIERTIYAQVSGSGFGEDAAYTVLAMASQTDGFRNTDGLQDVLVWDGDGNALSSGSLRAMARNAGTQFELSDDVKLTVELITSGDQIHFKNRASVQLAIGIEAEFEAEPQEGEGKVHINLSATFVQEAAFDPSVKGSLVYKEILGCIPVPTGVQVTANIDVRSFTALSLKAEIFTEEAEDESSWEKFQSFLKNPEELGDIPGLPDGIKKGVETVGDALKKIDELKEEINKKIEDLPLYENYIAELWELVEKATGGELDEEAWSELGDKLNRTDVTSELMNMLNLTDETGLSTEYIESLSELMDRYSELLEKETGWVKLVEEEMFDSNVQVYGVTLGITGNFIVRADLNLAIGSNLQYEVGKRYSFWFRVGLFTPTSGSSSMDLIDESFAFQFYVMGKMGIKAGVQLKLYAAIGSKDAISVGITTELGPYLKLYGFFIYDYSKMRGANTTTWTSRERMAGALFLEFGLYLMVGMEGKALWLEFDKDFLDKEFPLLKAGNKHFYYDTAYEPLDDADEIVVFNNGTASLQPGCAVSMELPAYTRSLQYLDLVTGSQGVEALDPNDYIYTVSNPNFQVEVVGADGATGKGGKPVVSVKTIPANVRLMQCDLTITYKHGKLAFSTFDMSATVHLVWTNMTAQEYQQVYTASVVVPNGNGGRDTIWSQRVRKGMPFNLPTDEEVRALLNWTDARYVEGGGYGSQRTEGVTLIQDWQYEYDLGYRPYTLTVNNVEGVGSKTFTTRYGEAFDLSELEETGKNGPGEYTRFAGLDMSWNGRSIDVTQPVTGVFAEALNAGAEATAYYEDETVTATFTFTGQFENNKPGDIEITLRRGDTPGEDALKQVYSLVPQELDVTGFYPEIGPMEGDTVYQVVCEERRGEVFTITFVSNGGSEAAPIGRTAGSVLGALPVPERTGYAFEGWFTDNGTFQKQVNANTKVSGPMTLYAKWLEGGITVTFNPNGGNTLAENTKTVVYGQPYGELPEPVRSGFGFLGWFTGAEDGREVTAGDIVVTEQPHTLYAHWNPLIPIPRTVFDFGEQETAVYDKTVHLAEYTFDPGDYTDLLESGFTIEYVRVGDQFMAENTSMGMRPITAGTYNVHITRDADQTYGKFDQTYTGVLVINRATRDLSGITADDITLEPGFASVKATLNPRNIDDLTVTEQLRVKYSVSNGFEYVSQNNIIGEKDIYTSLLYDLDKSGYSITQVGIDGDMNYKEAWSGNLSKTITLNSKPTTKWTSTGNYDISWYNDSDSTFTITTAEQLAGLAYLVSNSNTFAGKTIKLGADIDLSAHQWTPIGVNTINNLVPKSYPFCGVFDGNSNTISGVYVPVGSNRTNGLFGYVNDADIHDVRLSDALIIEPTPVDGYPLQQGAGGLAAFADGTTKISGCYSEAYVSGMGTAAARILYKRASDVAVTECKYLPLPTRA